MSQVQQGRTNADNNRWLDKSRIVAKPGFNRWLVPPAALLGTTEFRVNSMHHQGIEQVGYGLRVVARAGDGLPELASKYPSVETLLNANVDFFFAGWDYGMRVGGDLTPQTLTPLGINVYELTESCAFVMKRPPASMACSRRRIRSASGRSASPGKAARSCAV